MTSTLEPEQVDGAQALPFELASKIFTNCLPLRRRVRPRRNQAPLHLSQVCSRWRAIALATPQLWTSIYLEFPYADHILDDIPRLFDDHQAPVEEDSTASLLDLWFARAGGHPLSISLICSTGRLLDPKVFAVLSAYCSQWGRLELAFNEVDFLVFNEIVGLSALLQSLSIKITDHRFNTTKFRHHIHSLDHSPNLHTFQLRGRWGLISLPRPVDLPRTLTALQMQYSMSVNEAQSFPRLVHSACPPQESGLPIGRRVFSPLKSLILAYSNDPLKRLDLPALEHLQLPISGTAPPTFVLDFLSQSGAHLTHLCLDLEHTTLDGCCRSLSALPVFPALTTLELRYPACSPLSAQLPTRSLPALRNLIIVDAFREERYAAFVALLRSRPLLVRAELHLWSHHRDYSWSPKTVVHQHMPPPGEYILAEIRAEQTARRLTVLIIAPTWAWPSDAREMDPVGDLDIDVFEPSGPRRPYFFSPF